MTSGSRRWGGISDRWLIGGVVAVLAAGSAAIFGTASPSHYSSASGPPTTQVTVPPDVQLAAAVSADPANGTTGVALDAVVKVKTTLGKLVSVQAESSPGGVVLPGTFNKADDEWTSSGFLLAHTKYVITTSVISSPGVSATTSSSFTTLEPTALVDVTVNPAVGTGMGAGEPLVMTFNRPVTSTASQLALFQHLRIVTSPPVAVGGFWYSPTEVHLRPETYWPANEKISLQYSLAGWDAGGGAWGGSTGSTHQTVPSVHVSTLDLTTHELTVTVNGVTTGHYPITATGASGMASGTHIVLSRTEKQGAGLYWIVSLSESGSSTCAVNPLDQAEADQCATLSLGNAERFYYLSRTGDVVNVVGGSVPASATDRGTADWRLAWSALTPIPAGTASTGG